MGNRKRKQKHRVVSSNEESTIHPTQGSDSAAPPSSPTLFSTPTASTAATSAATCAAYKNLTTQPPIVHQDMLAKVPLMHQLSLELLAALLPSPPEWERVTVPELNFGIPSSTSHTTPSLDFDVFYKDLSAIAQVLEEFSVDFSTVPNRKLSKDERSALLKEKNLQIVLLVKAAIGHFNALTIQPKVYPRSASSSSLHIPSPCSPLDPQQFDPSSTVYPATMFVSVAIPSAQAATTPPESPKSTTADIISKKQQNSGLQSPESRPAMWGEYAALVHTLNSPHTAFDVTLSPLLRAKYHLVRARMFAVLPWKDPRVGEDLGRCLKLDPSCIDAWNLMGQWYFENKDDDFEGFGTSNVSLAKKCFESGLLVKRNVEGLLNLAQVLRMEELVVKQMSFLKIKENLEESEKLCREALMLDVKSGKSWFGLGCASLKRFFRSSLNMKDLQTALAAFNHAEMDEKMAKCSDLFGNRGTIHQFNENYNQALIDFKKSACFDPFKSGEDNWEKIAAIHKLLVDTNNAVNAGRDVSLAQRVEESAPAPTFLMQSKELDGVEAALVPEAVGFVKRGSANAGTFLRFEIIQRVSDGLPRVFVAKDSRGVSFAASIFNTTVGIKVGDELLVGSPCAFRISLSFEENNIDFVNLRIDQPALVAINGKCVSKEEIAMVQARFENL